MRLVARALVWSAALPLGCGPSVNMDDDDAGGTEGDDDDDDDASADAGGTWQETGAEAGDDGDVVSPDGVFIDCADLPDDGPPVGGGPLSPLGFPQYACNPRIDSGDGPYRCCSVDPAAEEGALPEYTGFDVPGGKTPYFADQHNDVGWWGVCIHVDAVPAGSGLTSPAGEGCPLPCNPTWDRAAVDAVCGITRTCCQTHELREEDCILDADTGRWRPVTGDDIGETTDWNPAAHVTHQDPAGIGCATFTDGDHGSPVFVDCVRQLTVADQRGYCLALAAGEGCPVAPDYVDACEALNR